jgi:hypothetical protein
MGKKNPPGVVTGHLLRLFSCLRIGAYDDPGSGGFIIPVAVSDDRLLAHHLQGFARNRWRSHNDSCFYHVGGPR